MNGSGGEESKEISVGDRRGVKRFVVESTNEETILPSLSKTPNGLADQHNK